MRLILSFLHDCSKRTLVLDGITDTKQLLPIASPSHLACWLQKHQIGLKGPMTTPVGKGFRSLNLTLRKELQLYANVRPCLSIPGFKTRYDNIDLVTIRCAPQLPSDT